MGSCYGIDISSIASRRQSLDDQRTSKSLVDSVDASKMATHSGGSWKTYFRIIRYYHISFDHFGCSERMNCSQIQHDSTLCQLVLDCHQRFWCMFDRKPPWALAQRGFTCLAHGSSSYWYLPQDSSLSWGYQKFDIWWNMMSHMFISSLLNNLSRNMCWTCWLFWISQWIGLRENLQESPIFNGNIYGFL
jgi:hypothetical protein